VEFDEKLWSEIIKRPDWPVEFHDFAKRARLKTMSEQKPQEKLNKQVRRFFEKALNNHQVCLSSGGQDFDKQRLPVDTIVIHHTSAKPRYRLDFLNAVQLLNIYAPVYATEYKGELVWSGHFHGGRQVFWGYHWLMRMDGSFERLLDDKNIGWHAGNWNVNRRSIGICLDNDYEDRNPRPAVLKDLARFIRRNYPGIKPKGVIGHSQARAGTICPGNNFIKLWKPKLLEYLADGP
jgi:hypothetical protein